MHEIDYRQLGVYPVCNLGPISLTPIYIRLLIHKLITYIKLIFETASAFSTVKTTSLIQTLQIIYRNKNCQAVVAVHSDHTVSLLSPIL